MFVLKIFVCVSAMGVAVFATKQITADMDKVLAVAFPVAVGAITYFVSTVV